MKKLFTIFLLMFAFSISKSQINIEPPTDDAFIYEYQQVTNFGSSSNLIQGLDVSGYESRILIKWDLSSLPSCITIDDAQIRLDQTTTDPAITVDIYRINESWNESQVNWSNQPTNITWVGSYTFNNTVGLKYIPVTTLVNYWNTNNNSNYGIILHTNSSLSANGDIHAFDSKEASSADPRLIITYTSGGTASTDPSGINSTPNPPTICSGKTVQLAVSGGSLGTGAQWKWYKGSCGGIYVDAGINIAVSPTSTTTYYVRAEGDCNTTSCASITVTVIPNPSAIATTQQHTTCGNNNGSVTASGGVSCSWSGGLGNVCTKTGVAAGTYTVTITDSNGCTDTDQTTVNSSTAPSTPPNPTSNSPQPDSVTITRSGTPPSGETWYWQGTSCGTNTSLGSGTTYNATSSDTYYIRAYKSSGSCWSSGCGSTSVIVGIKEIEFLNYFNIHPNPTPGTFILEMELTKLTNFEIKILNILGQVVYEEKLRDISGKYQKAINMSNSSKGIYNLQLINNEEVLNKKIILQ